MIFTQAKQLEALEKKRKEVEDTVKAQTPEGILEEKLRLQKIQEDGDLQLASELVGTGSSSINEEGMKGETNEGSRESTQGNIGME